MFDPFLYTTWRVFLSRSIHVYLPTLTHKNQPNGGKSTIPIDSMVKVYYHKNQVNVPHTSTIYVISWKINIKIYPKINIYLINQLIIHGWSVFSEEHFFEVFFFRQKVKEATLWMAMAPATPLGRQPFEQKVGFTGSKKKFHCKK